MFAVLASVVDLVHALSMVAWIAGLPLLFWRRFPRARRWFAIYAVTFIGLYQASRLILGECFLTTIARYFWEHGGAPPASAPNEWFTVRLSMAIFRMAPSHRAITLLAQVLILITAMGLLLAMRRARRNDRMLR